jgi:hypothetical protein
VRVEEQYERFALNTWEGEVDISWESVRGVAIHERIGKFVQRVSYEHVTKYTKAFRRHVTFTFRE